MKPGDKFAVNLNEHVVAEAVVIDIEDDKVTLDIPATRIVMGVKSSLTDLPDAAPEKERVLLEDKPLGAAEPNNSDTSNVQSTPGQSAPITQPTPRLASDRTNVLPPDAIGEGLAGVALKEME